MIPNTSSYYDTVITVIVLKLTTGSAKEVTPLSVFEFPALLDALYLQFLFTHVSLLLNDVTVT